MYMTTISATTLEANFLKNKNNNEKSVSDTHIKNMRKF